MSPRRTPALVVAAALALAACGDDGADQVVAPADDGAATTTTSATTTEDDGADGDVGDDDDGGVPTVELDDACSLVADPAGLTGLDIGEGVPDGDERRRVCAYTAIEPGQVGVTLGVQAGGRFDEKAEQSEAATGPGEEVPDLGDRALFFHDDEDLAEGVGGVLVAVGDLTIDVTLQGLDEATMRDAAVALATAAVANL